MFEYIIENGEVIITGIDDELTTEIVIPESIDGYPVKGVNVRAFKNDNSFYSINNIEVVNGFCLINNRILYYHEYSFGDFHNIVYEICGDYYCYFIDYYSAYNTRNYFFINKILYRTNFKL